MANIDLNVSPYFDDFDPNKDFLRVLFRPGFPVQARELTTLQSILQEQIKRFGDHVFKQGSRVTGARINFDKSANRVLLSGLNNSNFPSSGARSTATLSNIEDFIGKTISNPDGTVKAKVLVSPQGIDGTVNTGQIFIKYITAKKFDITGGYIYATTADNNGLAAEMYNTFSEVTDCSLAHIEEGVFYVSDFFTRVAAQTVIVDSKSITPSVKLGFTIETSLIEASTDNTLFDNARGSTNEGAPGAHRLKNDLKFGIRSIDENTDAAFFPVMTISEGVVQESRVLNPIYDELGKQLARRTHDESGDYSVDPLVLTTSASDSDNKFLLSYDSGKVYVRGHEIEVLQRKNILSDKPLTHERISNKTVSIAGVPKVQVDVLDNSQLPGFGTGDPHLHAQRMNLQDSDNKTIGVARAWAFENSNAGKDYLHIYDVKMIQQLELDNAFDPGQGGDIKSTSDTRGIVYKIEDSGKLNLDWDSDIRVGVIDYNRPFKTGQVVTSTVKSSAKAEIIGVTTFKFSDVKQIRGASGTFHAEVKSNLLNIDGSLYADTNEVLKTAREGSNVLDNNFNVLYQNPPTIVGTQGGISITPDANDAVFTTAVPNGNFDKTRIDDADEITKTLKFAYIKVRNPGSSRSSSINYGWTTQDKQINLVYPDGQRVFGIVNGSTNNEFAHFKQINITVTGGGAIPQGSIITGKSSGVKAIVALTNGAVQEDELTGSAGYHTSRKGTGNDSVLEIIFTSGAEFKAGETLNVQTPADQNEFANAVTYNSTRGAVITQTSEDFGYDVSANYLFDNGQREYFYDVARIERKNNVSAPASGDLTIFYSYLDADPTNKFFYSVDSYGSLDFFGDDVRKYNSLEDIKDPEPTSGLNVRNIVDFRLRAANNVNTGQNAFSFAHRTFKNQSHLLPGNALTSTNPKSKFVFDYDRYLPRKDAVYINENGELVVAKGSPSVNPAKPDTIVDAMLLNELTIPAAVRYPNEEIEVITKDNRRYTMRDIGDIENRIDRLEKAVSLSMLESQALHDNIEDRTKLGFIVDDFKNIDNTISDGFATTAITGSDETLRPFTVRNDQLSIEVLDPSTTSLTSNNIDPYYYARGFITKGYTQYPSANDPEWLTQPTASSSIKINPYAVWIYQGNMSIVPDRDIVREGRRITSFQIDRTGNANDSEVSREEFFRQVEPVNVGQPWLGPVFDHGGRFIGRHRGRRAWFQRTRRNTFQTQIITRDSAANFVSQGLAENTEAFIRSQRITISIEGMRANVSLRALFNGTDVTSMITPSSNFEGSPNYNRNNIGVLTTDSQGRFKGVFEVPPQTFPTGAIPLVLTDLDRANTTRAQAVFTARNEFEFGALTRFRTESRENTVIDIANNQRFVGFAGDPVAQTFMLPIAGNPEVVNPNINQTVPRESAFITSLDIFFDFVDVDQPDVICEIRNVVNGYPGAEVIGQSIVTVPSSASSTNASVATNFRFSTPVYLEGSKEYCIVLLTASPNTSVWTAVQGENDVTSGNNQLIGNQPNVGGHFGSFFKSQNNTTWTADQDRDLKFKIYKAEFNTAVSKLKLGNEMSNKFAPIGNASQGLAIRTFKHSNYVQIMHPNHGMYGPSNKVCLANVSGLNGKIGGIPVSEINCSYTGTYNFSESHEVLFQSQDSYFIKVSTNANADDVGGGADAVATQNTQFDSLLLNAQSIVYGNNTIDAKIKTTTGTSLEQIVKSQILSVDTNSEFYEVAGVTGEFEPASLNDISYFENAKIVRNKNNTSTRDLEIELTLNSSDSTLSPVMRMLNQDENLFFPMTVDRNSVGNLLDDSDISEFYPDFDQKNANDSDLLTVSDSDNDTKLRQFSSYLSSLESSNEHSDFVTQSISLETPADRIDIFFDADMNPGSELEFAFKAKRIGDDKNIDDQSWEDFKLNTFINEENYDSFSSAEDFRQYSASHDVGEFYDQLKIRIRLKAKNEAQPPRIKDLRIIANA